jgi:hypothetical protein
VRLRNATGVDAQVGMDNTVMAGCSSWNFDCAPRSARACLPAGGKKRDD